MRDQMEIMVSLDVKQYVYLLTFKWREMSWTLTKRWTIICGSRRDQEEGGELDSHEKKLDFQLRVQARSRGGKWCWTHKTAQWVC